MSAIENYDFNNKRALIRVDFNVPLSADFKVEDDTRMRAAIPTIKKVLKGNGSVVLMSHLGRPKNGFDEALSLKHLVAHLESLLGEKVIFAGDCIGEEALKITKAIQPGEVVLLDNLRFYKEETAGDENFAKQLAAHGDVYVNDAFGTAHRAHASTAVIAACFPNDKLFGCLLQGEIDAIDSVLKTPQKPLTAIVGGAKVSSKITIIESLLNVVDNLIIGGGMAYTFVKAAGGKVGSSLVEEDYLETAKKVVELAAQKGVNICLPTDTIVTTEFSNDTPTKVVPIDEIPDGWMGLDIGEESVTKFKEVIAASKTILWNGPMGVFEMENFMHGTVAIAKSIAAATKSGAYSLIGGGDSVAAINKFNLAEQVSYVSTGGGAMLEYLEGIELPGIAAI